MFEFIIGDIVNRKEDYLILQNNGIGYRIFTSVNSMANIELGQNNVMIYTYFNLRDDGVYLYGFTTKEEMEMFELLLLVSKIGPRIALGILSALTPNQIKQAIFNRDIDTLCKAPGVGKKTAERMILELKDRMDKNIDFEVEDILPTQENNYQEALQALLSLGYTRQEVERSIRKINIEDMDIEEIIREALKKLSRN